MATDVPTEYFYVTLLYSLFSSSFPAPYSRTLAPVTPKSVYYTLKLKNFIVPLINIRLPNSMSTVKN
jgi:hypothetical protein